MRVNEVAVQQAIRALLTRDFTSIRAAAKHYNIAESTLRGRIHGRHSPNPLSHERLQRLSNNQEELLVDWILEEDARGFPLSHARVREMANKILEFNSDSKPVSDF